MFGRKARRIAELEELVELTEYVLERAFNGEVVVKNSITSGFAIETQVEPSRACLLAATRLWPLFNKAFFNA